MDITMVANAVKGKVLNSGLSAHIAAGSRQVYTMLSENGALTNLLRAGISDNGNGLWILYRCGMCTLF